MNSKYVFLFDLDSTITNQEILPTIAKTVGCYEEMCAFTENTMKGEIPFKQSFLKRVDLLKDVPVSVVRNIVENIKLNNDIVDFIKMHRERCYIVTGNLDVWIEDLMRRINMESKVFCSKALVEGDHITDVFSVLDKNAVIQQMVLPFVAVGDGNNDAEMIEAAEIGIGYGGVREIAESVLECSTHTVYSEKKLVDFLERLV